VVPVHAWGVLEPCLKEALTNAARHVSARSVDVSLDVGPRIVRLCVHNPTRGAAATANGRGLGLHNLAQRARAVGGSISIDAREGFRLICVLPLGEDRP
jgi:signal transduction histidine kinase